MKIILIIIFTSSLLFSACCNNETYRIKKECLDGILYYTTKSIYSTGGLSTTLSYDSKTDKPFACKVQLKEKQKTFSDESVEEIIVFSIGENK